MKDIGNSSVKNEIEAHLSKNKTVLFTDGVTWYFFENNEKALEENKAEMFELGIRIIDEKKFDHIKWNESEKRYNDLKEKIKVEYGSRIYLKISGTYDDNILAFAGAISKYTSHPSQISIQRQTTAKQ